MAVRSLAVLVSFFAVFAASRAYCGNLTTLYENGHGDESGTPLSVTAIPGGGSDFLVPYFSNAGPTAMLGDVEVFAHDGVTPADLVRFVADSSPCADCVDAEFFVLSGGGLESDVSSLPAFGTIIETATEDASGKFSFLNSFDFQGVATHVAAPVPEPGSWLLCMAGFSGLGFAIRRGRRGGSRHRGRNCGLVEN